METNWKKLFFELLDDYNSACEDCVGYNGEDFYKKEYLNYCLKGNQIKKGEIDES